MKAAVYLGPGKMEIREVEKPKCAKDEVLLKVSACAVCGTDVRIFYHGQKNVVPPHITGHEIAGTVEEAGSDVTGHKPGDRVTVVTCVGCGKCRYCAKGLFSQCEDSKYIGYYYPGGFAQYMTVPAAAVKSRNIINVPDKLGFPEVTLIEPLSCVINGQDFLKVEEGDTVVIFGSGPIGCMHAVLAKARGAGRVLLADVSDTRLALAGQFSGITPFNSAKKDIVKEVMAMTGGAGADIIITACSANAVQEQALAMAAKRARISFFAGLPKDNPYIKFDSNALHYREISVFGAFASNRKQYEDALELISSGKIDARKFITHKFALEDIVKGFEATKKGEGLKSVIMIG